jgi:hypothetical protein
MQPLAETGAGLITKPAATANAAGIRNAFIGMLRNRAGSPVANIPHGLTVPVKMHVSNCKRQANDSIFDVTNSFLEQ